jgi:hypothetical protein
LNTWAASGGEKQDNWILFAVWSARFATPFLFHVIIYGLQLL